MYSTPPSSPPNFSRPTSRQLNKPNFGSPVEHLVHPLFRTTSPDPAPVPSSGTNILASPWAGQEISPRAVSRMRSSSFQKASREASPVMEVEEAVAASPTVADFPQPPKTPQPPQSPPPAVISPSTSTPGSPGPGSPGPSICDSEECLPPILPGFVLTAGQRSSLVGYTNRKSIKGQRSSVQSRGSSRTSMTLP